MSRKHPPKTQMPRWKITAFAVITLLVLLILLEGIARLFGAKPFPQTPYCDSPYEMEWELKPNYSGEWEGIHIETNSLGLRDNPVSIPKPNNQKRILFLGDSILFGFRLNQDDTIPAQMETIINKKSSSDKIDVMNAGVEGWCTYQQYHFLQRIGFSLEPDMVLLGFVLNDVFEQYRTVKHYGGTGYMGAAPKSLAQSIKRLMDKTAFFSLMHQAYRKARLAGKQPQLDSIYNISELFKEEYRQEIQDAWNDTLSYILQMRDLCASHNIPFMVIVFPYKYQLNRKPHWQHPQETLYAFCSENEIPLFDLLPRFQTDKNATDYFLDDNHFNPEGSRYIADILAKLISEQDLLNKNQEQLIKLFPPHNPSFN